MADLTFLTPVWGTSKCFLYLFGRFQIPADTGKRRAGAISRTGGVEFESPTPGVTRAAPAWRSYWMTHFNSAATLAEIAQDRDHCSSDPQNDRDRDLVNQVNQRELRLGLLDDVTTVWTSLSVLGYLTPALFAFYHRHKNLSERIDLSCALPLDNRDMTVPIGIPRVSTISLYERLLR